MIAVNPSDVISKCSLLFSILWGWDARVHNAFLLFTLLLLPLSLAETWPIATGQELLLHIRLLEKPLVNALGQEVS